jgi:hypothetical protein
MPGAAKLPLTTGLPHPPQRCCAYGNNLATTVQAIDINM